LLLLGVEIAWKIAVFDYSWFGIPITAAMLINCENLDGFISLSDLSKQQKIRMPGLYQVPSALQRDISRGLRVCRIINVQ